MISSSIFKKIYKIHVYVGLFVALHFLIWAVTGLILLFKDEFDEKTVTETTQSLTAEDSQKAYAHILEKLQTQYPTGTVLALFPEDDEPRHIQARVGVEGSLKLRGSQRLKFDLGSQEVIPESKTKSKSFMNWILELHREFLLGSNGKLYVGFVGFLYVLMLVSGFFIYGRFMKGRGFGQIRPQGIPKLVDLHKYVGVITFGWSFLVGLTGVFLAFNGVLIKLFQSQSLKHLSVRYQNFVADGGAASFEKIVASAQAALPESVITYISFPNTEFGIPGHHLFLMNGTTPLTEKLSDLVVVNSQTGLLAEVVNLPLYLKFVLLSEPLHFGDYGGWPLKILWLLFTLGSLFVVVLGVMSFIKKRQNRKDKVVTAQAAALEKTNKSPYLTPVILSVSLALGIILSLFFKPWMSFIGLLPLLWVLGKKGFRLKDPS